MSPRLYKSRFHRRFRKGRRQVEQLGNNAERHLERNFIRRLGSLFGVRRFVLSWLLLVILLIGCVIVQTRALSGYYQTPQPIAGGIYIEGIVGTFTNANPLYATGQVDDAVSRLLFSGLFKYNDQNNLVGDLASGWSVDKNGTTYTVRLRPHLTWQDGRPLTAQDVAFTYHVIQNPDAQSPLNASWQDVTIAATDDHTIVFKLPNPLSSFPYSLTTGIIPRHILGKLPMDQMRSASFNTTTPIGAGPFSLKSIQTTSGVNGTDEQQVALTPFAGYHADEPKLNNFIVHSFTTQRAMVSSYEKQELTAMVGLTRLPYHLAHDNSSVAYNMPLTAANYVFFKNSSGVLSDKRVRTALIEGANTTKILQGLGYQVTPVTEPLLVGQLGYNAKYQQPLQNIPLAEKQLTAAGWKLNKNDGLRYKNKQPLRFTLYAQDAPEYTAITSELKQEWRSLGADVQVYLQNSSDLQTTVAYHTYDALLYGISIGVDPDVFVYWDSSQADVRSQTRLNFSEYRSSVADVALEGGRTRLNPALRAIKYADFLKVWQADAPALGLYQPRFLYVTRGQVFGLTEHTLNSDTDRFDNVQTWMIREANVTNKN